MVMLHNNLEEIFQDIVFETPCLFLQKKLIKTFKML